MDRDQIISDNPIVTYVQDLGYSIKRVGGKLMTAGCPATEHTRSGHAPCELNPESQLWHCHDCGVGGSVIDWVMKTSNVSAQQAMENLGGGVVEGNPSGGLLPKNKANDSATVLKELETYNYTNENGQLLYQVVRYEPKTFKQRQPNGSDWKWNLDGTTRVLYNLPNVLLSNSVCVTEGEKDANTLNGLNFVATTNAGGSSQWLAGYAEVLKGKDVIVFPDNDPAGHKHSEMVISTIRETANSVKKVMIPDGKKDITDWLEGFPDSERAESLRNLLTRTPHLISPLPIYSVREMEDQFREYVANLPKRTFSMSRFSPKFNKISERLTPGEVVMLVGDTSVGKTAVMQAIAKSAGPLPTLFFELELPLEKMFMRGVQMDMNCYERDVIADYQNTKESYIEKYDGMRHIMFCPQSGIDMPTIEKYITKSELKFGCHPVLVMVDYMGLVRKDLRQGRYEAIANAAEQAKVIAKRTNTIMFVGSQVARPADKKQLKEVEIHSAKGAGELESSANLLLGLTRPDDKTLRMKVIKNTSGPINDIIDFDFNGATMQISEQVIKMPKAMF